MTQPPPPAIDDAIALHRAGKLTEARAAYQQILAARPDMIEAIHGLGLITLDLGSPARAIPLLSRCSAAMPDNMVYRASLGLALLRVGKNEEAAAHLLETANRAPQMLEPRLYLAKALGALKRWSQAVDVLAGTAQRFPGHAEVWAAKGNAERLLARHDAAEHSLRRALALTPDDAGILNNLAVVVRALDRTEEALGYYRHALARAPDSALIHANLGNALAHLGRSTLAEQHLQQAVALDPDAVEPRYNLAALLTREERPDAAIAHFRRVLAAAPKHVNAWTNLGVAQLATGDTAESEKCYRRAIALSPNNAEAHYNLAWVLLLTGQWAEGWQEYEWRWKLPHFSSQRRTFTQPLWDGVPLPGGTVLLHAEQGLGDAIQFARYAALAKQRCGRVIVECPRALVRLFEDLAGADAIVAAGDALPSFDAHAPFMTLPRLFATTPETVPGARSYLAAPAETPDTLRLPVGPRPRIGVVWAGSPDNKIDRRRSLPAALLAPLMVATPADFVSLQVGPRSEEVTDLPADKLIFACDGQVRSFADTAAVIAQLDLVIGVDTAVMHLAGALGKPAWILLPFMPDYRWLLGREDSPWYSSIRLFRQEKPGDWAGVLKHVQIALTKSQRTRG